MNSPHARPDAAPALDAPSLRRLIVGIMAVMVLGALDQAIVTTAMPTIGEVLGDFDLLAWVVSAYMLASTVTTPLYGKLSDIHGRRPLLLISIVIFLAGSVMCAVAPTMETLIAGRAIQGLGGGGLMALPLTIIADVIPPRDRGRLQAYFAVAFAAAMILGPLLGGLFAAQLHWSLIFWINLPIVAVAYLIMRNPLARMPAHHRPHKLDVLGGTLMTAAAVCLLLALDWGGGRFGWGSSTVQTLAIASALLWAGFAFRNTHSPEPLLPFDVLRDSVVAWASAASFLAMGAMVGIMMSAPIYFEGPRDLTTGQTALVFLVLTIGTVIGSSNAGRLIRRVQRYKLLAAYGMTLSAVALTVAALLHTDLPLYAIAPLLGAACAGFGTMFPVGTVAVQNAVAPHNMGIATAAIGFLRSLGGVVGAALVGTLVFGGLSRGTIAGHAAAAVSPSSFTVLFAGAAMLSALAAAGFFAMENRPLRATVAAQPQPSAPRGAAD